LKTVGRPYTLSNLSLRHGYDNAIVASNEHFPEILFCASIEKQAVGSSVAPKDDLKNWRVCFKEF